MLDAAATALDLDRHVPADHAIERSGEWNEFSYELAVDTHEDVSRLEFAVGRRFGNDLRYGEHAGLVRIDGTDQRFRLRSQPKTAQLIVGAALKNRL